MNNKAIQQIKEKISPTLKQAGVTRSAVFGSFAGGVQSAESGIDVLVEFRGEKTLLDLISLKSELKKILGRKVDLITYRSLSPLLRDKILRIQVPIYG